MKYSSRFRNGLLSTGVVLLATAMASVGYAQGKTKKPKPYPLKVCIVSDEKLGEMGKPYVFVHEDREIKFCCKGCLKDFSKQPAEYIKKLEETEKAGKAGRKSGAPEHHPKGHHQH